MYIYTIIEKGTPSINIYYINAFDVMELDII